MSRLAMPLTIFVLLTAGSEAPAQDAAQPLVTRNRVQLNVAGAEAALAAAKAKAAELKIAVNIAVVDDGGLLIAFVRMDNARPGSVPTAVTKATAAATFRQPTGPLPGPFPPADAILSLGVALAAEASGGKATPLLGGVPITVDGQVIGAVGVGGATGEQDLQVAKAGVAALLRAIEEPKPGAAK